MRTIARIIKKFLEFVGCIACLGLKIWTDIEATRVYYTRQKFSREWPLLNNIFWNRIGDAYAWITYGGFSIITLLLGIAICIDSKSKSTYAEKIFLFIGSLMFFGIGALVLASIDSVPSELVDNAIVLGVLSFIVAFVFLIDMSEKMGKQEKTHTTQTDTSSIDRHFTKGYHIGTVSSEVNLVDHDGNDRKSIYNQSMRSKNSEAMNIQANPMHSQSPPPHSSHHHQQHMDAKSTGASSGYNSFHNHQNAGSISHDENYHPPSHISEDIVQSKTYPTAQMPTFSKVKQGQYPTVVNHLESEPYKKILSRASNPNTYSRYQDPAHHQENPTFYEDFSKFRQESYYQGPKVDNKLMVIRDYSAERRQSQCNCHHPEHEDGVKAGYVAKVAKLYDDQSKMNHSREPRSLDTHV